MKKFEKIIRILNAILCFLDIGCLFFSSMTAFSGIHPVYRIFRSLSFAFSLPMFFMRTVYLQYILYGIIAVSYIVIYWFKIKNKCIVKKYLYTDIILCSIAIAELFFLESYFINILTF